MDLGEGQVDQCWIDPKMKNRRYRNTRPIWHKWDPADKKKAGRPTHVSSRLNLIFSYIWA